MRSPIELFMKQVELFMRELFQARIDEEKRILANRAAYRKKFFTCDCRWDNREFALKMIETERVLSIENSGSEIFVITEFEALGLLPSAQLNQRRYHLKATEGSFLICLVELQCPYCRGKGDDACPFCKGTLWK